MYMFNRNKDSQSISQFISKGQQIIEEDVNDDNDDNDDDDYHMNAASSSNKINKSNVAISQKAKAKIDEDFMFQMDKGI
jgi:hypothetical protein